MVRNTQPANAEATSLAEGLVWAKEQSVHQPTLFGYQGNLRNYNRVAFEADIPAITPNPPCHHRINAGVGCTTPPPGAQFCPIYSTTEFLPGVSGWQEGGGNIQGTISTILAAPQLRSMARCCSVLTLTGPHLLFWSKTTVRSLVKIRVSSASLATATPSRPN